MKNFIDICGVLSMILGISLSAVTIFTYNYGEQELSWFDIFGASFVCSISLLILGILQVVSTGVVLSSRNRQDKLTLGIVSWIITQFLVVLGIFSCYIVLNYASLDMCPNVHEYNVLLPPLFHIIVLVDLVFLIFCIVSTLWFLPKLLIEEIISKYEYGTCNRVPETRTQSVTFQQNLPIFTLDLQGSSQQREFPPSYFQ